MNDLDSASTIVCGVSILFGLLAYKQTYDYLIIISYIMIILINVLFILKIIQK